MELVAIVVAFGVCSGLAARAIYVYGRLAGMKQAMAEMASGVGAAYQRPGTPLPSSVRRGLAAIERNADNVFGAANETVIARAMRDLGKEMGAAARQLGFAEGLRPRNNDIRIDLPLRELLAVRWLAHAGFKLMMRNKTGGKFSFLDQTDAQESNFALDRLERLLAQEHKDPTTPYALGLCRQQMIWERWPQGSAAPAAVAEPLRNAA